MNAEVVKTAASIVKTVASVALLFGFLIAIYHLYNTEGPKMVVTERRYYWRDEYRPAPVPRRIPAGTRDDPFVGEGTILGIKTDRQHPSLLLRHEEIPNFMFAMIMQAPVASVDVLQGLKEGMSVTVSFEIYGDREFRIFRVEPVTGAPQ